MKKYETEYITIKTNPELIGKKAKFKEDNRYCSNIWGRTGIIKQLFQVEKGDLDHVGLSIVFNKKKGQKKNIWDLDSCYILPNSYKLLGGVRK